MVLKNIRQKNYKYIFAGHGAVNSPEALDDTEKYLEYANAEMKKVKLLKNSNKK